MIIGRQRPLQPFRFRGAVPEELSYEDRAALEEAARRGRSVRQRSTAGLRKDMMDAQAKSSTRIRIERPVANYAEFVPQMAAWYKLEIAGMASRRKLGRAVGEKTLHLTLLDTRDPSELLGTIDDSLTEEDLQRKLGDRHPGLFKKTGRVAFTGLELFGPKYKPWVALPISPAAHSIYAEQQALREVVAPHSGPSGNRLHTSLGDITVHDVNDTEATFQTLRHGILPLLPAFIEYDPVRITVEHNPQN